MGLIAGVGEQISEPDNLAVYLQSVVQHDRIGCGRTFVLATAVVVITVGPVRQRPRMTFLLPQCCESTEHFV